jgi:hypothetical protein
MPGSLRDDAEWERVWRQADDEFLTECAKDHLRQNLQTPQPGFNRFSQICREAHRRGKPELLRQAIQRLVPIRTASVEDRVSSSPAKLAAFLVRAVVRSQNSSTT